MRLQVFISRKPFGELKSMLSIRIAISGRQQRATVYLNHSNDDHLRVFRASEVLNQNALERALQGSESERFRLIAFKVLTLRECLRMLAISCTRHFSNEI